MALYDFPPSRLLAKRWSRYLRPTRPPTLPETPFPTCCPHYPGGALRCLSIASRNVLPSRPSQPVGLRIFTFEACSRFTHVTARRIARLPKAAFVTRLRPGYSPTARQLPDRSTLIWMDPSSTGVSRHRGAREGWGGGTALALEQVAPPPCPSPASGRGDPVAPPRPYAIPLPLTGAPESTPAPTRRVAT